MEHWYYYYTGTTTSHSSKRIGEVHSIEEMGTMEAAEAYPSPVPGFIPKASAAAEGTHRLRPSTIPALTYPIGNDRHEPDRLLCPGEH